MTRLPMVLMSDEEVARFGRDDAAGFGALRSPHGALPLVAMDVDTRVAGVVASTELAQTFVNQMAQAIEATYIFPLPDRAAVHRFRMEVAGRVVEGVVEERGAARERYDEAIAAGHRASIAEEERAGVFTLRVGNLLPGEAATVRLSLVGPLPVDDGEVTFRFPLVVAPRYMPGAQLGGEQAGLGTAGDTSLVPDASRISPPVLLPGCPNPVRLSLRVALEDAGVRDVASSLHAVTTRRRDAHLVEVQPGERLDRDFILRWRIDGAALRSSLVCADDADGGGGTFLLTLVPPSTTAVAAKPRHVVFVLDRSGSMEGWKMVAARRAVARMIDTLTSRDRFCVLAFDNVVERIPDRGLVEATDRERFRAVEALAKVDSRGGTEMLAPLQLALAEIQRAGMYADRERVIVLVTDGQVGNEDHLLREIAPSLRGARMFALGIDQAVNAAFLRRLASAGGGLCELVESEDRLDEVMAKVHRRIGTPVAAELRLSGAGLELEAGSLAPARHPDVYAGAPVSIFGRYRGSAASAAITVDGTALGEPLGLRVARDPEAAPAQGDAARWLHASWARARIRDLEDRYATGDRAVEREIVELSKQRGVLSRFTAYLAVDRAAVVNPGGRIRQVVQAVESPADKAPAGACRTSTMAAVPAAYAGAIAGVARASAMPVAGVMRSEVLLGSADDDGDLEEANTRGRSSYPLVGQAPPAPARATPASPPPAFSPPAGGTFGHGGGGRNAPAEPRREALAQVGARYLVTLVALTGELDAQGRGRADAAAIRLIRQRLTEWVEDVRSVGGQDAIAAAVELLVTQLSAALAAGTGLAREATRIAAALKQVLGGTPPTEPAPEPAPESAPKKRWAFWK